MNTTDPRRANIQANCLVAGAFLLGGLVAYMEHQRVKHTPTSPPSPVTSLGMCTAMTSQGNKTLLHCSTGSYSFTRK